jgi:SAM-dependent methyltransferase
VDRDLEEQVEYWNGIGVTKRFGHPVNMRRLQQSVAPSSRIVDVGCGYGRALEVLFNHGYRDLFGFDVAPAMIAAARARLPDLRFAITAARHLPLADASVDALLLFTVLTCVPSDVGQRAIVREAGRVLRPGGVFYISDLWLQPDERNRERYRRYAPRFGTYGVFELPEGVVLRHHDREWIAELTGGFSRMALEELVVETMNGHMANAFQWFGCRRLAA